MENDFELREKFDVNYMFKMGYYFGNLGNYDLMKKYYLMAIEHGSIIAMFNLGCYYDDINDFDEMKKYYLMAIKYGNIQ